MDTELNVDFRGHLCILYQTLAPTRGALNPPKHPPILTPPPLYWVAARGCRCYLHVYCRHAHTTSNSLFVVVRNPLLEKLFGVVGTLLRARCPLEMTLVLHLHCYAVDRAACVCQYIGKVDRGGCCD